ncbi:MFS transporter [Kitasatospora purpeofusca]|uniref:MFS transporter n=1 Tax=Kitasatospora purpeofusca TaxID=67352 RepID=UPI00224CF8FF|nr:MFS transporter [Kitasatospora purpeofusca]MCX4753722.1 MFS transporter [Kitasatospora purpeofusca]WSR33203.1 MFS transporter [Kitasatospora purpeofusca]WSR41276.1 MFS transporter [Kitasatospora purpeofusca]
MTVSPRGPNERLGTLLTLAQISNAGLARRVNDLGAQRGLTLRYDKTSVARWVSKGMVPQGPVPHLIATAIGGKLGRPVPLEEIGLGDTDPAPELGLAFPREVPDAVRSATDLWRVDLDLRRGPGGGRWSDSLAGTFSVAAYATPVSRWLINPADGSVARELPRAPAESGSYRVGHSDAAKLREAAQEARRWDSKYGGGDWRSSMVPECLRVEAAPLLLASYSDAVGRALFGATAELTRLAGWMAFDTGQHEAAQRYYIQALRLARAAADVPLGGYVLASMSLQAGYRGFAEEAVDLAQAALERNRGLATARTMSFFHLVEARAQAKARNAAACATALGAAESALERARAGDPDPAWIDFYAYDRLAADAAECFRDLGVPAKVRQFTREALARPTEGFVRSHGLRLVVSAMAEAEAGNLDAAVAAGERAVDVAGRISSQRSREYVVEMLRRLEPFQGERRVRDLTERARAVIVAPA